MNEKVIYFSLNRKRAFSFFDYIVKNRICYRPKFSFSLVKPKRSFKDPRDLITLIEEEHKKDSLHIIIDYISCCDWGDFDNHATVIRDIIMAYPEIQFLFDETFVSKTKRDQASGKQNNWCFLNFLFQDANDDICNNGNIIIDVYNGKTKEPEPTPFHVLKEFHQFDLSGFSEDTTNEQFIRLLKGCNNMYDGSNLRCAIKSYKFSKLHVKNNFKLITESRHDHAAIVVEEEYHQAMFNSYCLHANGFRVLPVMTATELHWANNNVGKIDDDCIVVRDYDLQFVDESSSSSVINSKIEGTNLIDYIRGAKDWSGTDWSKMSSKVKRIDGYSLIPMDFNNNPFWGNFIMGNTFFVSKGDSTKEDNPKIILNFKDEIKRIKPIGDKNEQLQLYGIKKPLEGIYASMQEFKIVHDRYHDTIYRNTKNNDDYKIEIGRQGDGGHSCPLDIYGIARSMVHRAGVYYYVGRHRLAALVAGEAIELLNGFHLALMKQAYYIQAVSENAMAMSLLGGDEDKLCKDLVLRLEEKVKRDVERMIRNKEDRMNLLMNIYNDCRLFCREKEYLTAADDALSIIMQEKESLHFSDLFNLFRGKKYE